MGMSCGHEKRRKAESEGRVAYVDGEGIFFGPLLDGWGGMWLGGFDSWRILSFQFCRDERFV